MIITSGGRQSGKTRRAIQYASDMDGILVVPYMDMAKTAQLQAEIMKRKIEICAATELANSHEIRSKYGSRSVVIDELEMVLREIFGVDVVMATTSAEVEALSSDKTLNPNPENNNKKPEMRSYNEIMEDLMDGKKPDYEEVRLAALQARGMLFFAEQDIKRLTGYATAAQKEDFFSKIAICNLETRQSKSKRMSPDKYLGNWHPDAPGRQEERQLHKKIAEKFGL